MEIKFELTSQDLAEYHKIAARENKLNVTSGRIIGVVLLFIILADFLFNLATGAIGNNPGIILLNLGGRFILLTILLLASSAVLTSISRKMINNMDGSDKKNGLFCEHRIILDEKEFVELTDVNISRHSWAGIGEVSENEKFVVIPVNLSAGHIIPKRSFDSEKQMKSFIETVVEYKEKSQERFNPSYLASYELKS